MLSVSPSPNRWIKMIIDYILLVSVTCNLEIQIKAKPQQRKGNIFLVSLQISRWWDYWFEYYASMA